jgi:hypothetical protein
MTKKNPLKSEAVPTVITICDHHDTRSMQEEIEMLASCHTGGGAHVYAVPAEYPESEGYPTFLISAKPLTPKQVIRAYYKQQKELARELLTSGETPGEVWAALPVSARDIGKIAKEERIKLPRNWFAEASKKAAVTIQ